MKFSVKLKIKWGITVAIYRAENALVHDVYTGALCMFMGVH